MEVINRGNAIGRQYYRKAHESGWQMHRKRRNPYTRMLANLVEIPGSQSKSILAGLGTEKQTCRDGKE